MTQLSPEQVARVALAAGFKGDGAVKAVAVALAESGGRTDATNTNSDRYRSIDRGLWQINSHWHPEVSAAQAFNPAQAAAAAFRISKGGSDWSQWSTWKNGSAATQMGRARLAVNGAGTGGATAQPVDLPGPDALWGPGAQLLDEMGVTPGTALDGMRQTLVLAVSAARWISDSHNWARVAFVVGGGAALLMGAAALASSGAMGSTAQTATGTVKGVVGAVATGGTATAAKAAKAVTK